MAKNVRRLGKPAFVTKYALAGGRIEKWENPFISDGDLLFEDINGRPALEMAVLPSHWFTDAATAAAATAIRRTEMISDLKGRIAHLRKLDIARQAAAAERGRKSARQKSALEEQDS